MNKSSVDYVMYEVRGYLIARLDWPYQIRALRHFADNLISSLLYLNGIGNEMEGNFLLTTLSTPQLQEKTFSFNFTTTFTTSWSGKKMHFFQFSTIFH